MTQAKTFLDKVYDLDSTEKTLAFYGQWAQTYDDELRANGYASPARVAAAMAQAVIDRSAPMLDIGCGTGLSGEAFKAAGFTTVDGTDFSPDMLAVAAAKNIYRAVPESDEASPVPANMEDYQNFAAVGVFSPGHAPPSLISLVAGLLPRQGCFGFTLNDHALEDPDYEARIKNLVDAGQVDVAFREYGEHIPKLDLKSMVYVLQRR